MQRANLPRQRHLLQVHNFKATLARCNAPANPAGWRSLYVGDLNNASAVATRLSTNDGTQRSTLTASGAELRTGLLRQLALARLWLARAAPPLRRRRRRRALRADWRQLSHAIPRTRTDALRHLASPGCV